MHSNFNDLKTKTMTAKKYLLDIGFDDAHLPELFNNDDKSNYQISELMEAYHQSKLKLLGIGSVSKSVAKQYAEFCVRCDREGLPLLELDDYIKQYCG